MLTHYLAVLGQGILGLYFILAAHNHLTNTNQMARYAASKGIPSPKFAVFGSGLLLLIGGAGIITGMFLFYAIFALVIFLIPVSFTMHAFWKDTDPAVRANNRVNFTKNMALLGALLILWSWPYLAYHI